MITKKQEKALNKFRAIGKENLTAENFSRNDRYIIKRIKERCAYVVMNYNEALDLLMELEGFKKYKCGKDE